jgi:hypothetical protein
MSEANETKINKRLMPLSRMAKAKAETLLGKKINNGSTLLVPKCLF